MRKWRKEGRGVDRAPRGWPRLGHAEPWRLRDNLGYYWAVVGALQGLNCRSGGLGRVKQREVAGRVALQQELAAPWTKMLVV